MELFFSGFYSNVKNTLRQEMQLFNQGPR